MNSQPSRVDKTVVYTPESPLRHPWRLLADMFRDAWRGRELAWCLAAQEIRAKYRQTALGILWVFVTPVVTTLAWLFIQASGAVEIRTGSIPYPVFVITGVLMWSIFADAVVAPLQQAQAARKVLAQLPIPPESLVLSGIYQVLFTASVKTLVLVAALAWLGAGLSPWLLLVPVVVLSFVLVGTMIGLAATPVGLLYNDVGRALPLGLQFLMYLCPVVYAVPPGGWAARIVDLNPVTTLLEFARAILLGGAAPGVELFILFNVVALLLLVVVWMVFRATLPVVVERLGT